MAKVWTLASLVAAAMVAKDGKARVRISRELPKEFLEARYIGKDNIDIALHFISEGDPSPDGDVVSVTVAKSLLKRQKAKTPKLTKAAKKARAKAVKAAKKALLIAVVPAPVAEGEKS